MGGADLPQKRGEKMGVWICKKSDLILHFESSLKIFYWGIPLFAAPMKYCSCFLSDSGRRAIPRKEANNHCFPYKKKNRTGFDGLQYSTIPLFCMFLQ